MADKGISYFPNAVFYDDNVELIIAEYGMTGLGILNRLWQKIYSNGYYCDWNDDVALLFARKNGVGCNVVSEVLQSCFRREVLNLRLYEEHEILTSKGIQERYFEAVKRRQSVEVKKEYLLVDINQIPKNVNIIEENVYISGKNVYISEQSKVKESKVKESKVRENKREKANLRFTPPALEDVKKYCDERGNNIVPEKFIDYYTANGWMVGKSKMKDWKAAIRNWEKNDFDRKQGQISRKPTYDLEQVKKDAYVNTEIKYK